MLCTSFIISYYPHPLHPPPTAPPCNEYPFEDDVVCQYGKIGPTTFGLDFKRPLSVASLGLACRRKLTCEFQSSSFSSSPLVWSKPLHATPTQGLIYHTRSERTRPRPALGHFVSFALTAAIVAPRLAGDVFQLASCILHAPRATCSQIALHSEADCRLAVRHPLTRFASLNIIIIITLSLSLYV